MNNQDHEIIKNLCEKIKEKIENVEQAKSRLALAIDAENKKSIEKIQAATGWKVTTAKKKTDVYYQAYQGKKVVHLGSVADVLDEEKSIEKIKGKEVKKVYKKRAISDTGTMRGRIQKAIAALGPQSSGDEIVCEWLNDEQKWLVACDSGQEKMDRKQALAFIAKAKRAIREEKLSYEKFWDFVRDAVRGVWFQKRYMALKRGPFLLLYCSDISESLYQGQ